jgi:UDP-N-acetyl-D-galactosamine dehydrogenase
MIKLMIAKGLAIKNARVLIMGITFKENCPDIRNTKIVDIRKELIEFGCIVDVIDPWANTDEVFEEYGFQLLNESKLALNSYSGIVLGVAHEPFRHWKLVKNECTVIYDVKGMLEANVVDGKL